MISLSSIQILPPTDDKLFEQMVCEIFNSIENTSSYDLFGRSGQKQNGIDIYSLEKKTAIQCKHKLISFPDKKVREELLADLIFEFNQFITYNKSIGDLYSKFIFATTFKNDTLLINKCQELNKEFDFIIEYWHWDRLTSKLDKSVTSKYSLEIFQENINYYKDNTLKIYEIDINTNLSFIEQIEQYFKILFDEVTILHSDFFLNHYPFITKDSYTNRTNFTIDSDNEILTEFFDSFDVNSGIVEMKNNNKEEKLKVEVILKKLVSNSLFYFRNNKKDFYKKFEIDIVTSDTYYEKYDKFNFTEGLNIIPHLTRKSSLNDFMKLGYFYYKIGNLIDSIEIFKKAKEKAISEKKDLIKFICDHNLYHLGRLVNSRYWDLPNKKELTTELLDINLSKIYSNSLHIELYNHIYSRNFFNEPKTKIQSLTNKVNEKYNAFLRGGESSINYELDILYEYSILHSFLLRNYIIYDCYKEYKEVVQIFLDGFLASYAIKNGEDGLSSSIDDYYLNHIIEYLETKTIEQLFLKYQIFKIDYEENPNHGYSFVILFENLTNNNIDDLKFYFERDQTNGKGFSNYFWTNRKRLLQNFIYLSGIINFDTKTTSKICDLVIKHISENDNPQQFIYEYLIKFLVQKKELIPRQKLKFFLIYLIKNTGKYPATYLTSLCEILKKGKIIISFTKRDFTSLIKNLIYFKGSELNYINAINLYGIVRDDFKIIIKEKILKELETNFSFDIYYHSVMYDLFSYNYNNYFEDCINTFDINNFRVLNQKPFFIPDDRTIRYLRIDEILNICFKFNIDINDSKFDVFKGVSNYYDWILNIENYNYHNFVPYWIDEYGTTHYDNYFKKYDNLKKEILKSINSNDDNRLRKIYHRIYSY